jgi:hypothetical protein
MCLAKVGEDAGCPDKETTAWAWVMPCILLSSVSPLHHMLGALQTVRDSQATDIVAKLERGARRQWSLEGASSAWLGRILEAMSRERPRKAEMRALAPIVQRTAVTKDYSGFVSNSQAVLRALER